MDQPVSIPRRFDRAALSKQARALHDRNYNCAQSVACALAPLMGLDEDICFRLMEGLGGGMGGFTETCGAIAGGAAAIGFANSNGSADPTSKKETYALAMRLVEGFRAKNGSTLCGALKGTEGRRPLRSCPGCIDDALMMTVDVLEDLAARRLAEGI